MLEIGRCGVADRLDSSAKTCLEPYSGLTPQNTVRPTACNDFDAVVAGLQQNWCPTGKTLPLSTLVNADADQEQPDLGRLAHLASTAFVRRIALDRDYLAFRWSVKNNFSPASFHRLKI
jgi:hypothetical protein